MNTVFTIAAKELRDGLRSRWLLALAGIFGLLAVGLVYFGGAPGGMVGFVSLSTTVVSLASLAVFLIPLMALLLSHNTIVGEDDQGTLLLLLAYPISRRALILGKFLGNAAVLTLSILVGSALAALAIATSGAGIPAGQLLSTFALFVVSAALLGWAFIAIGFLISVFVQETSRAIGLSLVVWFFFVLLFDLAMLGMLVGAPGLLDAELLSYALLLNPADSFRLINMSGFEAARSMPGVTSIMGSSAVPRSLMLGSLLAWFAVPLGLAAWLFRRRAI